MNYWNTFNLEKAEINNVRTKLSQQTLENNNVLPTTPNAKLTENQQSSANTAKSTQRQEESNIENVTVSQVMATATVTVQRLKKKIHQAWKKRELERRKARFPVVKEKKTGLIK